MTDKDLLELAAKANGMTGMRYSPSFGMVKMIDPGRPESTGSYGPDWNPLKDDGDALRLAVKLKIEVRPCGNGSCRVETSKGWIRTESGYDDDMKATRRAIVRTAAELGKTMP